MDGTEELYDTLPSEVVDSNKEKNRRPIQTWCHLYTHKRKTARHMSHNAI